MFQPHYVRDYRRLVRVLTEKFGRAKGLELAVGGEFEHVGRAHAETLRRFGLRDDARLVDVGCGAGRTAFALRHLPALRFHGTDVVQELLDYAREKAARPDWRFTLVDGLYIPADDASADMVTMFSVLTHLTANEGLRYLTEARRVLADGGSIVVSFLDRDISAHRAAAGTWLEQIVNRLRGDVKNVTHTRVQIEEWARKLALTAQFHGPEHVGQSLVIFTKPI